MCWLTKTGLLLTCASYWFSLALGASVGFSWEIGPWGSDFPGSKSLERLHAVWPASVISPAFFYIKCLVLKVSDGSFLLLIKYGLGSVTGSTNVTTHHGIRQATLIVLWFKKIIIDQFLTRQSTAFHHEASSVAAFSAAFISFGYINKWDLKGRHIND